MLEVIISYTDKKTPVENFSILTYLRGDGYWQFLTTEGSTISIPDHAVQRVEIIPMQQSDG
tara:strand:- start:212 stop:394 length:183 start_codon:yes stop_codon:yes gene_type:complete